MREIKFRAWLKKRQQIVEVSKITFLNYDETLHLVIDYERDAETYEAFPTDYEIMQFTGLRDKYGKEIYEGDFVKDTENRIYIVKWIDSLSSFKLFSLEGYMINLVFPAGLEVIGNIYENPELLLGGDK
jgi:uncharacterized phage protein (TIGR01671 family)